MSIQGIGFADPTILFGIHPWCFRDWIPMGSYRAGQDSSVGGSAFNDPERISIGLGASGDPGNGPANAGRSSGKIPSIDHRTSGRGKDRVDVLAGVSINPYDKWV